jgi:hypothetical protein
MQEQRLPLLDHRLLCDTIRKAAFLAQKTPAVAHLLQRARRRQCVQLVFEQAGVALGVGFGGLVILLLIGTQVLEWYWLFILFAGALVLGGWRVVRLMPEPYRIAQILDARLRLYDAVSTAYFFDRNRGAKDPAILALQREQAERAAAHANVAEAFPYAAPKALYAAFGVALVAFGMFAVRYGVTRRLDLRPSLVKIAFDTFKRAPEPLPEEKKAPVKKRADDQLQKLGVNATSPETDPNHIEPGQNSMLTAANSDANNARAESDAAKSKAGAAQSEREVASNSNDQQSDQTAESGDPSPGLDQNRQADGAPQNSQRNAQNSSAASKNEDGRNSLLDKMRDAMANLLNKMKLQSKGDSGSQMARSANQQGSQAEKTDKNGQATGRNKSDGSGSPGEQSDAQAQGEQAQTAQAKAGQHGGQNQPSRDAKSGIGKEDGDKSNKLAEQLDAMGKISEIFGKRAQNMTGEVMVEVSSGSQQLRTEYSGRTAAHADTGGEISRDEVPLMYRQYVQHYFEQIRRAPSSPHGDKPRPGAVDLSAAPTGKKAKPAEE